ncbi:MAG: enoyl-CoA hydratase/isomerase family protein [Myxococcota bacterium]|nr:enoyl-CoA hydratase/isomerase family protein [Myxococcota bacterium]
MGDHVRVDFEGEAGEIAIVSYDRADKHNAFSDAMDKALFQALAELRERRGLRCVIWRGEGRSFSSGRDLAELGVRTEDLSDLEFIERGHRGSQAFLDMPCPILVGLKGHVIGGSFERALLCDVRVAGESARMRLPEIQHGVVPDSGGTARLHQMAGHGLAADLALTGRPMDAEEALRHGVVSRVVPDEELDATLLEMARGIAATPEITVKMFLRTLRRLANPEVEKSLAEEALAQATVFGSDDYAEMKAARAEERKPVYRGR